tara:strand:- start:3706 stop:3807 length:102 start_codon:yes stop_codon:yes gene_type:complete
MEEVAPKAPELVTASRGRLKAGACQLYSAAEAG